ncbi:helix-turn-helix domain-containing protein [Bosea sp. NBC_00550]|uniref:helix-turn-helix domain-containing protein n=1 Tax=Bosea sp. NBC_00550 TaxID=2969621 RepID=UPI0022316307|nr:helix-turn-helix domain-containing protein [Bosea sp. NBC_00550]UZF93174.1 helix-turn-helix domain-containing protein [Bosea sp. NBC_00550]
MINYSERVAPLAYGPREACKALNIGLTNLYAEIKAKRIPVRKHGRRTLIAAHDLKAWLDALPSSERKVA